MLDDIAEELGKAIFKGVSRFVCDILIEIFFFYTGEIFLYLVASRLAQDVLCMG